MRDTKRLARLATDPISVAMLLGALSACISTCNSLSPRISWQGGHESPMGLMTVLALLVVYFAARTLCPDVRSAWLSLAAVVAGQPEVGLLRAADEEGVVPRQGEGPPGIGPLDHGNDHAHASLPSAR